MNNAEGIDYNWKKILQLFDLVVKLQDRVNKLEKKIDKNKTSGVKKAK